MRLSRLLSDINVLSAQGSSDTEVRGIAFDSREVDTGFLYLAQAGEHADGHDYIDDAIRSGAAVVVHGNKLDHYEPAVSYIKVKNPRICLSPIAAAFYRSPSSHLQIAGITGTNGKSTTAYFLYQLLHKMGCKSGLLSTVAVDTDGSLNKNPVRKSTTDASEVQASLRHMVDSDLSYAVVEATSHGLASENNRLGDVHFNAAVFTNITHEHLNFHGTFERYLNAKANLFRSLDEEKNAFGIVNGNDPNSEHMTHVTGAPIYTFALNSPADLSATEVITGDGGYQFSINDGTRTYRSSISLPGTFNIENALAAILTALHLVDDAQMGDIIEMLPSLTPPIGRMKRIEGSPEFNVYVDYAHSPDSFRKILPLFREITIGRLICVFGSAGEGDLAKRPVQGQIASKYCDIVVLADEDPRGEDPMTILEDIAAGCKGLVRGEELFLIPNRSAAIHHAVSIAEQRDTIILLGKGHESTIVGKAGSMQWNEEKVAEEALAARYQ